MFYKNYSIDSSEGWVLDAQQYYDTATLKPDIPPLLLIPGYGMNSFILGFHPTGKSMIEFLVDAGHEVWTIDMRGQGKAKNNRDNRDFGLEDLALKDLPVAIEFIVKNNRKHNRKVDLIGCSLGGTVMYSYIAIHGSQHISSIIGLGSPLRWDKIHPLIRILFYSESLARKVRIRYTRKIAQKLLPIIINFPALLHLYMHPEIIDLSQAEQLTRTIEDPSPKLNGEMARWFKTRDLILDKKNISQLFSQVDIPLFIMLANADGVVPEETGMSAYTLSGASLKDYLVVGNNEIKMAHADMYISYHAEEMVFQPLGKWIEKKNQGFLKTTV